MFDHHDLSEAGGCPSDGRVRTFIISFAWRNSVHAWITKCDRTARVLAITYCGLSSQI